MRSFGSEFTALKKVFATLWGLFGAQGIVPPSPSRYTPAHQSAKVIKLAHANILIKRTEKIFGTFCSTVCLNKFFLRVFAMSSSI